MQAASRAADVVIIGGGITGCSAAYHLARAGSRVIVLEKGAIACEASGRNRGAVRLQMRHPLELPMTQEAVRRWRQLDEELGTATEFRTVGAVMVTYHEEDLEGLAQEAERHCSLGVHATLLTRKELKEVVPGLSNAIVGGMYTPDDGHANPQLATLALARAAVRAGATVLTGVKVTSIRVAGGRVLGLRTDDGEYSAAVVVVAAGVWTPELCRPLGLDIPIVPWRREMVVTDRVPKLMDCGVRCTGPRIGFGQTLHGSFVFGLGPPDNVGLDLTLTRERIAQAASEMARIVPALRDARIVRCWTGWFEVTPDDLPIIGRAPDVEGLVIAAGYSGHGFAFGPAVGKLLAELILDGRTSLPIDAFRPSRFEEPGGEREEPVGALAKLRRLSAEGLH